MAHVLFDLQVNSTNIRGFKLRAQDVDQSPLDTSPVVYQYA